MPRWFAVTEKIKYGWFPIWMVVGVAFALAFSPATLGGRIAAGMTRRPLVLRVGALGGWATVVVVAVATVVDGELPLVRGMRQSAGAPKDASR